MIEPENLVSRWSRLKREAESERQSGPTESAPSLVSVETSAAGEDEPAAAWPGMDAPASQNFDPASLPPIESITGGTDIRSFLQSGVPATLTRAALRRAWVSDPAIRDFIGIAENQWDFTDPDAIPGFGPLRDTDDMPSLVAQALGKLDKSAGEVLSAATGPLHGAVDGEVQQARSIVGASAANAEMSGLAREESKSGAAAKDDRAAAGNGPQRHRRPHGSALPQ